MLTNSKETFMEGLTTEEVETAVVTIAGLLPGSEAQSGVIIETGETETGARYVVAMREGPDGLETRTVCRERGQLAVLDTEGRVTGT